MTWRPVFQKELQILIRLTTEQFSTLPQSILNEPWPRENACASGSCLDMAYFLTLWREEQTTDTVGVASGLGEAFIKQK